MIVPLKERTELKLSISPPELIGRTLEYALDYPRKNKHHDQKNP